VSNAFVLGSNINATNSGYTYVNGIIANNNICATNLCASNCITSNNLSVNQGLSSYCIVSRCSIIGTNIADKSIINNSLTINGTVSSQGFTSLFGNRYTTSLGNGTLSSFTVNHNLSTTNILTTVTDNTTKQIVYPSITVTNSTQIQVGFSFVPTSASYNLSILGF
jgi:hypothetical protein